MTSMPEVIARLRATLTGLRPDELREIHHHLTDNLQPLLTQLATETNNPDLAATPELLANALTAIGNAADLYDHATNLTHDYIADHDTETSSTAVSDTRQANRESTSQAAAPQSGRWKGKTATDYADIGGHGIGRKAPGSKKFPVREVRSTEHLLEIFEALSEGGTTLDLPGYRGTMVMLPDGTTVGYRVKSRTSSDPTIDVTTARKTQVKIHVNTECWT